MADYAPELRRILRAAGCTFRRSGRGDHEVWFSPITERTFPVDSKIRSRHTANGVLKTGRAAKAFLAGLSIRSSKRPHSASHRSGRAEHGARRRTLLAVLPAPGLRARARVAETPVSS